MEPANLHKEERDQTIKTPLRLRCSVHNYDWGKIGLASQVARLFSLNSGTAIDPNKPYAEFWIGTHESGPSFVDGTFKRENGAETGNGIASGSGPVSLKSWILENPDVIGGKVLENWGADLPFLFKVLSVEKVLSIQAHPDKDLARALHRSQPSIYKDANHKPEMALAITEFEALCGFISFQELNDVLCTVPEIVEFVGGGGKEQFACSNEQEGKVIMESIFSKLLLSSKDKIAEMMSKMKRRLCLENEKRQLTEKEQLVLRLEVQYPADAGVMAAFFLNHVRLNCGEALYLGPNEPHAYIYGDCVECMAASDNVVRAGLTSKQKDVKTLLSMFKYKMGSPEILQGISLNPYTTRYLPPYDEFEVDRCILPQGASVVFPSVPGPSLFLFFSGRGTLDSRGFHKDNIIKEGDVVFVPACLEIRITSESTELQLYRAGVNSRVLGV